MLPRWTVLGRVQAHGPPQPFRALRSVAEGPRTRERAPASSPASPAHWREASPPWAARRAQGLRRAAQRGETGGLEDPMTQVIYVWCACRNSSRSGSTLASASKAAPASETQSRPARWKRRSAGGRRSRGNPSGASPASRWEASSSERRREREPRQVRQLRPVRWGGRRRPEAPQAPGAGLQARDSADGGTPSSARGHRPRLWPASW